MSEKVAAIIREEVRGASPEALKEVSACLKTMVAKVEDGLRTINQLGESWPVASLEVWAPSVDGGPQIEHPSGVVSQGHYSVPKCTISNTNSLPKNYPKFKYYLVLFDGKSQKNHEIRGSRRRKP